MIQRQKARRGGFGCFIDHDGGWKHKATKYSTSQRESWEQLFWQFLTPHSETEAELLKYGFNLCLCSMAVILGAPGIATNGARTGWRPSLTVSFFRMSPNGTGVARSSAPFSEALRRASRGLSAELVWPPQLRAFKLEDIGEQVHRY